MSRLAGVAVAMAVGLAAADTFELPRSSGTMPVGATVECIGDGDTGMGCAVSLHCGPASEWESGVAPEDFETSRPNVPVGRLGTIPTMANGAQICAVHIEGEANLTAYRHHRWRASRDDPWTQLSREEIPIHRAGTSVQTRGIAPVAARDSVLRYALNAFEYSTLRAYGEEYCNERGFQEDSNEYRDCTERETATWNVYYCDGADDASCSVTMRVHGKGQAMIMPLSDWAKCATDFWVAEWQAYPPDGRPTYFRSALNSILRLLDYDSRRAASGSLPGRCVELLNAWIIE
ncbi:MAG: hypothetical protein F4X36_11350 [Gammaproteobacteria bacterium]|nr:hypothetical protein [Gammaproteobacteria bacterium]